MAVSRHLAFDLGAGSGRAIMGTLDPAAGRLELSELARFPNQPVTVDGHLHWDFPRLAAGVTGGLRAAPNAESVGVDTWGVDFGLLDRNGNLLGLPFAYRDRRTDGAMESFFRKMPPERLYALTGIQFMQLNTVFQLESMVRDRSPLLEKGASLLFMPDLFHHLLAGVRKTEFTFATTSQMYDPAAGGWSAEVVRALGIAPSLMQEIVAPGTVLGPLAEPVRKSAGAGAVPVVAVATHDTGSAVAAVPAAGDDWAFLSSGTWSLLGIEVARPVMTAEARALNFTNEGGVFNTTRLLRNITGMWLLEECRRAWAREREIPYEELLAHAEGAAPFAALVDPDAPAFAKPGDMPGAIRAECARTGQRAPDSPGGMTRCILESLALKYRRVLEMANRLSGRTAGRLHVIGGGSRNRLLCRFAADACGIPVIAGPVEATAAGNVLMQAVALGKVSSLAEARRIAANSFTPETHEPHDRGKWDEAYGVFSGMYGGG